MHEYCAKLEWLRLSIYYLHSPWWPLSLKITKLNETLKTVTDLKSTILRLVASRMRRIWQVTGFLSDPRLSGVLIPLDQSYRGNYAMPYLQNNLYVPEARQTTWKLISVEFWLILKRRDSMEKLGSFRMRRIIAGFREIRPAWIPALQVIFRDVKMYRHG